MNIQKNHDGTQTFFTADLSVEEVDFLIEAIHEKPCGRCGFGECDARANLCEDWLNKLQDAKDVKLDLPRQMKEG